MEKIQNRRSFLKKVSLFAGLTQLPLMGWPAGFSTMVAEGLNPSGEFSLLKLEKLLSGYKFPVVQQFSTDKFHSTYKLYNLYGDDAVFAGEFILKSELKGKSRSFDFSISRRANSGIKKGVPEFKYIVSGKVECKTDATLSPEKWKVSSRIALAEDGVAFDGTGFLNEGEVKKSEISIKTTGKPIIKSFGSMPLSWKWGLPAVVQNMAESHKQELHFASLDEFDTVYNNQKIRFRRTVRVDCGNNLLTDFNVFGLTGDGIIPTFYWVDHLNRTVFVISGMEAYVLEG